MMRRKVEANTTHEVTLRLDVPRPKLSACVYGPGYEDPKQVVVFTDRDGGQALEDLLVDALAELRACRRHGAGA